MTIAAVDIQICPTDRTQPFAIYSAKDLHGKSQQNLLANNIAEFKLASGKKRGTHVLFREFNIVILIKELFIALTEEKIKRTRNPALRGLQATRATPLHGAFQGSGNPDFLTGSLDLGGPHEWAGLTKIIAGEINGTRLESSVEGNPVLRQILKIDQILRHLRLA
jgi:hypothetical protein